MIYQHLNPAMQNLFHLYIFAGLSFAFALINLIIGFYSKSREMFLFFGLISACVGVYYVLFPHSVYGDNSQLYGQTGLVFFILAFGLFPWFFMYYGRFKKNYLPWILSSGMLITFILFIFDQFIQYH